MGAFSIISNSPPRLSHFGIARLKPGSFQVVFSCPDIVNFAQNQLAQLECRFSSVLSFRCNHLLEQPLSLCRAASWKVTQALV